MGRQSRRKAQRKTLTDGQFYKLQAAIANRALFHQQAQAKAAEHDQAVSTAMADAGLDPARAYTLDEKTLAATPKD